MPVHWGAAVVLLLVGKTISTVVGGPTDKVRRLGKKAARKVRDERVTLKHFSVRVDISNGEGGNQVLYRLCAQHQNMKHWENTTILMSDEEAKRVMELLAPIKRFFEMVEGSGSPNDLINEQVELMLQPLASYLKTLPAARVLPISLNKSGRD